MKVRTITDGQDGRKREIYKKSDNEYYYKYYEHSAPAREGEKKMMNDGKKVCRKCGMEIINGINGCMLKGDICDACSPGRYDIAPPRRGVPYCEADSYAIAGRVIQDTD